MSTGDPFRVVITPYLRRSYRPTAIERRRLHRLFKRRLKGFYLYFLFLSVFLTRINRSVGFRSGQGQRGEPSCYEIEHPTANNRKECQNFSKQNLFTDSRQSGAKKTRLGALFNPREMKNRGRKASFLHTYYGFVHVFCPYLVPFRVFLSTPKNKKSTPNFFSALTF